MPKKQPKTMHVYYREDMSAEFFFEGDQVITGISGDDGNYRGEYMDCLLNHFGVEVKHLKKLSKKQQAAFDKFCDEQGFESYEDEVNE
jgi:hypothetical protein